VIRILYRATNWIAVDKPAGALVIPGRGEGDRACLRDQIGEQLGQRAWVVHRLDRDTSGVLLFALDAPTHRILSIAFEAGRIEKIYWALVHGHVERPLELEWSLARARQGRMRTARTGEAGKPARTLVRPIEAFRAATLIEAQPLTGKTHQIRVHLSRAGHPLLVDPSYARDMLERGSRFISRTPLHAARVSFRGISGLEDQEIASPMPSDMQEALRQLRMHDDEEELTSARNRR
jgi:tRNA pseudouridine32 synthase/23S rRNA pseudouridine746 synthase/23S rRNA pseudouridine955/2504/2580 synthase